MYDELKRELNLFTGELISAFIPFDKTPAINFQTGLLSLSISEASKEPKDRTNLFSIKNADELQEKLSRSAVSPIIRKQAYETVISGKGMPRDVPPMGLIAVTLGLVSNDLKNELMTCQAANRTINSLESWGKTEPSIESLNNNIYDARDASKPARHFIGGFGKDPQSLVAAQATNHMGDILCSLIAFDKNLLNESAIIKAKQALSASAATSLISAGQKLSNHNVPRAKEIIAYGMSNYTNDNLSAKTIQSAINYASDALLEQKIISTEQNRDIKNLSANRAYQTSPNLKQNPLNLSR